MSRHVDSAYLQVVVINSYLLFHQIAMTKKENIQIREVSLRSNLHRSISEVQYGRTGTVIIFIRYRASRPTLHINPTITSPHTHYIPSDPSAAGASFSSFSSSRQASVFDLLPSPAALATRAQGEGSPPHAAAAPSQRRPSSASSLAHRQPVQPPVGAWHRLSI